MTVAGRFFKWVSKTATAVKVLFTSGKIQTELEKVVDVVNVVKRYADSPIAVIIVNLTKTQIDNQAREWLSKFLQKVLDKYNTLKSAEALQEIAGTLAQRQTGLPLETASIKVEEVYQASKLGV